MQNISDIFVNNLYKIVQDGLPNDVREQACLCLIDYVACAIGGAKVQETESKRFFEVVASQGGDVPVIGFAKKTTLNNAAFIQAMNVHSTELDDGHRLGMIHLGASIISALLPVAEVECLAIDNVLLGIVVGYEAAIRIAMAMQPSHKIRGYHTSGTCGTIGSAIAIATAMGFSRKEMKTTLAAATSSAAGLLEMQEDESQLKPYNLAQAAVGGITAAYTAKTGFMGPNDPLAGKRGLLAVMSDNHNLDPIIDFKTIPFEIMRIYRKPYAACRHCHPAIEAALWIKDTHDIKISNITSIDIDTYKLAVGGHDHTDIKGLSSAKLSIPFSVALALMNNSVNLMDFNQETINDVSILELTQKVKVYVNEKLTSWSPRRRSAIVRITTSDGNIFSHEVDYPKGEPENPMSQHEVITKYHELFAFAGIDNKYTSNYLTEILK